MRMRKIGVDHNTNPLNMSSFTSSDTCSVEKNKSKSVSSGHALGLRMRMQVRHRNYDVYSGYCSPQNTRASQTQELRGQNELPGGPLEPQPPPGTVFPQ